MIYAALVQQSNFPLAGLHNTVDGLITEGAEHMKPSVSLLFQGKANH